MTALSTDAVPAPGKQVPLPLLAVEGVSQDFPEANGPRRTIEDVSFSAERAETICILGPSGCGKSTLLRMISGMYDRVIPMPTRGEVRIRGQRVEGPQDSVLTVFQKPVLKAWLNVRNNVLLPFQAGLWGRGVTKHERHQRVDEVLRAMDLGDASGKFPRQLSGGMQQRVALAARLVLRPAILCLDEPFSALDPETRREMQNLTLRLWQSSPCLALFVTHDVSEALLMADRVIVLSMRPARLIVDLTIAEPKPRNEAWPTSREYVALEQEILQYLRGAGGRSAHGVMRVSV